MKLKSKMAAAALSYAHLLGIGASAAAEDQQNDQDDQGKPQQRADESDEDFAKRMEEEDKKQRDDESDEDYAKRMEQDDGQGDEDDSENDSEKEQAARKSERARCAAIFRCAAAATRPDVAAHLAFNTSMSAKDAASMLSAFASGGAPTRNSLASRMAAVPKQNIGAGGVSAATGSAPSRAQSVAEQILAAGRAARGEA